MNDAAALQPLGTYDPADVIFLLKKVSMPTIDVVRKEEEIQSGRQHYSEMISREETPADDYMALFRQAMVLGRDRMGHEVARLAQAISARVEGPITLASLVRAGVPLGALLKRALSDLGRDVEHFGISIIRDRGLDDNAMRYILSRRPQEGLLFVDGWTGKGAIATQLRESFLSYGARPPRLVVLADPGGQAWLAASGDDWLIPSGILGSTVSGLISRSILNAGILGPDDFHGCVEWLHLSDCDISRDFLDDIWKVTRKALPASHAAVWPDDKRSAQRAQAQRAVEWVIGDKDIANRNRVKPGIAEATRAILRRVPEMVFVSSPDDPELRPLMHLIETKSVPYRIAPSEIFPYRAITVIRKAV